MALGLDEIAEDVIKELYHLTREQKEIRDRDLIRAADLQPNHFPSIISELERRGWVRRSQDTIQILRSGEKRALELIRAHRLWERYLSDKEGMPLDAIHEEAMRREHQTSPEEADRLARDLGFPTFDPHGDPIPQRDVDLEHHAEGIPLSRWPKGRQGRVSHVEDEPPALFTQLSLLGLTPGAQMEVDERTPGRVLIWSGRRRLALAPAAAE